jgi:hypothetical protein
MGTRREATIRDLRAAVDRLPRHTRVAMLDGIRANDIVVGAYSNRDGICPMLAAHRCGGRTSFVGFARAWDRFALRQLRSRKPRRATERELRILTAHLEASLLADEAEAGGQLAAAIHEHRNLLARNARRAHREETRPAAPGREGIRLSDPEREGKPNRRGPRPGDPARASELKGRPGWAWLRVMRRYDDYRRALELLEAEAGPDREELPVHARV